MGLQTQNQNAIDFTQIDSILRDYEYKKSNLIAILQKVQEKYRYLPEDALTYIGTKIEGGSPATVYGVATFYAQFSLYPKGQYKISVCLGTACYVKGSGTIYDKLQQVLGIGGGECTPDGKFSLEACRCVGACGLAPVMMVNDDVFGKLTADDVEGILAKFGA